MGVINLLTKIKNKIKSFRNPRSIDNFDAHIVLETLIQNSFKKITIWLGTKCFLENHEQIGWTNFSRVSNLDPSHIVCYTKQMTYIFKIWTIGHWFDFSGLNRWSTQTYDTWVWLSCWWWIFVIVTTKTQEICRNL